MRKVLVDRELLERVTNMLDAHNYAKDAEALMAALAQPAEAEGVRDYLTEFAEGEVEAKTAIEELQDALSAVTAERDRLKGEAELSHSVADLLRVERDQLRAEVERLRDAAGKAIAWLDAEQNGSGVGINRRLKLCSDAENSLRAAMAAKEA
ncbi:hypothetical protein [Stutzerimonas stutzeri]|uniref:hypothetical protein n=1 Tax=Stutzerimonas stutzeri TaxID=316 RepID=UPI002446AD02|nr:hypothetical protein [Stutzerimonas stutzeri]MDH0156525.1 hypothetical protein [Stutzerimonas stutzeri]